MIDQFINFVIRPPRYCFVISLFMKYIVGFYFLFEVFSPFFCIYVFIEDKKKVSFEDLFSLR